MASSKKQKTNILKELLPLISIYALVCVLGYYDRVSSGEDSLPGVESSKPVKDFSNASDEVKTLKFEKQK